MFRLLLLAMYLAVAAAFVAPMRPSKIGANGIVMQLRGSSEAAAKAAWLAKQDNKGSWGPNARRAAAPRGAARKPRYAAPPVPMQGTVVPLENMRNPAFATVYQRMEKAKSSYNSKDVERDWDRTSKGWTTK